MNCPHCNSENDDDNVFCVSCGETIAPRKSSPMPPPPTELYRINPPNRPDDAPESVQTLYKAVVPDERAQPTFNAPLSFQTTPPAERKSGKFLWIGAALLFLIIGGGIGGYFLTKPNTPITSNTEKLPDHLGIFLQNKNQSDLTEVGKQDFSSVLTAKDDLSKNGALPVAQDKSDLFVYYDSQEVPLGDLKLVQIDSIKDDGSLKQINYQAAPVDGKTEIKRLRVPEGLANGKYAFALFDGFLDEGKHKFWAFQVSNAAKSDNGELAKSFSLALKPKTNAANSNSTLPVNTAPTPKPAPSAPAGAQVAYCKSSNVVMRISPNLNAKKINALKRGQKIYIINYSENYDYWNGTEGNWAYVQTETGSRGWVFSPLIGGE